MFSSADHDRLYMPGLPAVPGRHFSRKIELPLFVPIFLITYAACPGMEDREGPANELLSSVEDIVTATYHAARQNREVDAVCLICPPHMNGTSNWALFPIAKISLGWEPEAPAQAAYVFQTQSGQVFVYSLLSTQANELTGVKDILSFTKRPVAEPVQ